jgi:ribonucleoside-diphosphate reductase alpha chain
MRTKSARRRSSTPTPRRRAVDQGLSLTLFFPDTATTRDINKAQIYAWKKGIKTLYYIRLRQLALEGTEIEGCVSCAL